jgi:glutamate-1-semialdehyde 2,1-aminomutase
LEASAIFSTDPLCKTDTIDTQGVTDTFSHGNAARPFRDNRVLREKSHALIPGGCHTYAKGDDQFPEVAPPFIERGLGCHVWDIDGNEYIEYGMGLRSVSLGHAYPDVLKAVRQELERGTNFTRPSPIEVECAEAVLGVLQGADQIKFTKDGSTATTAALRLARAYTGRDLIAYCADHPFFSYDDWFLGKTTMNSGVPRAVSDLSLEFRYNDLESVRRLFDEHPGKIAGLIMEPAREEEPRDGFLHGTMRLCHENGAVFILDENITGFRWHIGGAQRCYGIVPDLTVLGKAMSNGFALSALAGRREIMELGGIHHGKERVFLLSTTHGAETHALAAAIATIRIYRREPVIEHLYRQGRRLADGFRTASAARGLSDYVNVVGRECNLVFFTHDQQGDPSQEFRTLFLQELVRRGVLAPSLVVSYSHSDEDVDRTITAVEGALDVYQRALEDGAERYLIGPPSRPVIRKHKSSGRSSLGWLP